MQPHPTGIASLLLLFVAIAMFAAGTPPALAAGEPPVETLSQYKPAELFEVANGTIEQGKDGALRWGIAAGQTSELSIRRDHPVFSRLRSFDRLQFEYRIASGAINTIEVRALGHVSGPRAHRVHQSDMGLLTTQPGVWHTRAWDFNRPSWLPWVNEDGEGTDAYFLFASLALEPNTFIELRNVRLVRGLVQVKPFYELPITWPVKQENADGSVTYSVNVQVLNAAGKPVTIGSKLLTEHSKFRVAIEQAEQPAKASRAATFKVTATISKADIAATPELYAEPLRIAFFNTETPEAVDWYSTTLVRPLSKGFHSQVLLKEEELKFIREKVAANDAAFIKAIDLAAVTRSADKLLPVKFVKIPTQTGHSVNNYPPGWVAGDFMPEIVNSKTGERQSCTNLAGVWWQSFFNVPGNVLENTGLAYLLTGDEKYAQKGVELMKLYGQQYSELPWNLNSFGNPTGPAMLGSSRVSATSTYGTNWLFKGHLRMLSAISDSKAWADAPKQEIYTGFALPYATEIMKFPGGISNMTDITNHNLLLLGFVFDDAGFVYFATKTDPGLTSRLRDITDEGFSSEGRPIGYHFAAMAEYLPSITYLENSGLKIDYPRSRLPAAIRMAYQRASLNGTVPNTGDCGRYLSVSSQRMADYLFNTFPEEKWLFDVGADSTLSKKIQLFQRGEKPNPTAWKSLLETTPRLFPQAGMAILRTGDTPDTQVMATLDYGRNFFHAALDRLQFTLIAYGKVFTHGPGSLYNVGSGNMTRGQSRQLDSFITHDSLSHNLVMVDATNQSLAVGRLLAWSDKPGKQVAVATVDAVRPGVSQTRGVVLTNGVLVILDQMRSEHEHVYDFVYHNFGVMTPGQGWTQQPVAEPLARTANYENIVDLKRLTGSGAIRLDWDLTGQFPADEKPAAERKIGLQLWQTPISGGEVYTGVTGLNNPNTRTIPDAAPSLFHRFKGKTAQFLTVLEPHTGSPRMKNVASSGDVVTVTFQDGSTFSTSLKQLIEEFPAGK